MTFVNNSFLTFEITGSQEVSSESSRALLIVCRAYQACTPKVEFALAHNIFWLFPVQALLQTARVIFCSKMVLALNQTTDFAALSLAGTPRQTATASLTESCSALRSACMSGRFA